MTPINNNQMSEIKKKIEEIFSEEIKLKSSACDDDSDALLYSYVEWNNAISRLLTLYTEMVEGELSDFALWWSRKQTSDKEEYIQRMSNSEAIKQVKQYLLERKETKENSTPTNITINNNQMSEQELLIEKILQKAIDTMQILPNGNAKVSDEAVKELLTLISHERAEAYKKGAEDFCRWNCSNADGGYVQDLENFMQSEEYLSKERFK